MCDQASCAEKCPRHGGTTRLCVCDPDADRLSALIAEGIPQRAASLMLWAPHLLRDDT